MSSTTKNIVVLLIIALAVFAGYYFLTQDSALSLNTASSSQQLDELLVAAEEFNQRQQTLNSITLDTSIFDSPTFQSLRDFSPQPDEFSVGRPDPFLPTRATERLPVDSSDQ